MHFAECEAMLTPHRLARRTVSPAVESQVADLLSGPEEVLNSYRLATAAAVAAAAQAKAGGVAPPQVGPPLPGSNRRLLL